MSSLLRRGSPALAVKDGAFGTNSDPKGREGGVPDPCSIQELWEQVGVTCVVLFRLFHLRGVLAL